MPTSHSNQINKIVQIIRTVNPQKLLDIGMGFGKYGFLAREYLELWDGRERYNDWTRTIDGIEVFEDYVTGLQRLIYSQILIGNAIDILPNLTEHYDLTLLIDVLEHFGKEDGIKLLKECIEHSDNILISVPNDIGNQGDAFDNIYETHRFQWESHHFVEISKDLFFIKGKKSLIAYVGKNYYGVMAALRKAGIAA